MATKLPTYQIQMDVVVELPAEIIMGRPLTMAITEDITMGTIMPIILLVTMEVYKQIVTTIIPANVNVDVEDVDNDGSLRISLRF